MAELGTTSGTFGVVLNAQPSADVTVTLAAPDGETTITSPTSPSELVFTTANWATPQIVEVQAVDDGDTEGSPHTGNVTFAVTSGDAGYSGAAVLDEPISIEDDDVQFRINEIRISATGAADDTNNFVEIFEASGGSLSTAGLHLIVMSGEFNPGNIDFAIDLTDRRD